MCVFVFRLCDNKKTKVFLPELPFPHSEVGEQESGLGWAGLGQGDNITLTIREKKKTFPLMLSSLAVRQKKKCLCYYYFVLFCSSLAAVV